MKKRNPLFYEIIIAIVLIALILLPQILGTTMVYDSSASHDENGYPTTTTTLEDLQAPGTRFGFIPTNDWSYELKRKYPNGDFLPFTSMSDTYIALETGKLDATLAFIDQIAEITKAHPTIAFIRKPVATLDFGFGLPKTKRGSAICKEMNRYLKKLKESGEFDALLAKWQDKNRQGDVMGDYHFSGEKGTLKVATEGLWTPMTFYIGDQLTGFFVELVKGFCQDAGYKPHFETVSHSASIAGTVNGSYDVCANPVLMTEERLAMVNITDPLMTDDVYLVVNADMQQKEVPRASAFFSSLKESFIRTFITEDRYKILLSGLGVTISLSIIVGLLGTILGAFICYLRMRKNRWVEAGASLYIRLFRGIPVVVLLMVLYYLVFKDVGLTAYWVAIIAFSIDFSAYVSEIFRSGILAVPEGQTSAAKALGFNQIDSFRKVVWPQAMIHILPVYSGQFIATVKMTSVAGYISVMDLTKASDIIRARTYEAFFPLFVTSATYLLLSGLLVLILQMLEKRIDPLSKPVSKDLLAAVEAFDKEERLGVALKENIRTENSDDQVLLKVEHLKKSFEEVTPVKDMTCDIRSGDVIAIIGPSGTGKSTFLNLINHLLVPDGGRIIFEGKNTLEKGYDYNRMREKIGMVFQSFNLFSHLTVLENIMLAQTDLLKRSREEACQKSLDLLQMVGMRDKALSFPSQLSGGQQQRIAIIRALAMDPVILLFDEPTSALDPTMVGEVLAVIRSLANQGMTMLVVTHEMRFARDVSNRVFFMDEGIIYEDGEPDQIFANPRKDKTRQFINHLKVLDIRTRKKDFNLNTAVSQVEEFSYRHMINRHLVQRMLTLTEELCFNTILPLMKEDDEINILFEYGDSGRVDLSITYPGENQNPMLEADPISLKLIQYASHDISYEYIEKGCFVKTVIE